MTKLLHDHFDIKIIPITSKEIELKDQIWGDLYYLNWPRVGPVQH
jgi:hypothetical protein